MTKILSASKFLLNFPKIKQFQYSFMNPSDFDEVADIIAKALATREPILLGTNTSEKEFKDVVHLFKDLFLAKQLSLIVRDTKTQKIAAAILADDYNVHVDEKIFNQVVEKLKPVYSIIGEAQEKLYKQKLIPTGYDKVYHVSLVAADQDYVGLGLYKTLSVLSQHLAWSLDYSHMVVESSSPITQHICNNQGYQTIEEYPYEDMVNSSGIKIMNLKAMRLEEFRNGSKPCLKIQIKKLTENNITLL